ncbi:MAG TPA: crotonase/enoyl-CoA hydratase family protein [Caulobacteraceae bacterium]|nr:crotonase/enoyl-CoA hydratase family protein [Caulobacteraceae bacterium]
MSAAVPVQNMFSFSSREPSEFPHWAFQNVDLEYDAGSQSVWMYYKEDGPPFYSLQTLIDMASVRESLRGLLKSPYWSRYPIRYFVMASRKPGIFNLGGDLAMFAKSIREQEREQLRAYAHACIDVVHGLATAFGLPIVTLSVITGQALGGGLEAALAEDFILVDETAKVGVPEVAFNTFPGMGAVSLLSRRLGEARAEEIIGSGKVYSGREMFEMGVVDILAAEGRAMQMAVNWMTEGGADRYARRLTIARARRRFFPVSYNELIKITDLWVNCSFDVTAHDIRHMERLAAAQKRLVGQ